MARKAAITFERAPAPVTPPVTKFGGQPAWISEPEWPTSKETKNQMSFICQVALDPSLFPAASGTMAYVFMTEEEDGEYVDGTWEPNGGENAVVIQPGKNPFPTTQKATGPTLYAMVKKEGHDGLQQEACEFTVGLAPGEDVERAEDEDSEDEETENKIGGLPDFIQGDEVPEGGAWRQLLQLDSCNVPFYVNFGDAGVGYAFIDEKGESGKFLWQGA